MGHTQSRPELGAGSLSCPEKTGSSALKSAKPDFGPAASASAWTSRRSRLSRLTRSQRRSMAARREDEAERAKQRQEVQRYLADAIAQQREAEQTLAETLSVSSVPRLVMGDYGAGEGGLDALKRTSTSSQRPGSSGSGRSGLPDLSTSSSVTLSSPSRSPFAATGVRSSRWSESSASSRGDPAEEEDAPTQSSKFAFHSFRNSLNRLQRDRLSVLLDHPDKLDDTDVAVASALLFGRSTAPPTRRLRSIKVRGPIRIVASAPMSHRRYSELEQRRAAGAAAATAARKPEPPSTNAVLPMVQPTAEGGADARRKPCPPAVDAPKLQCQRSTEDLSDYIAASPQLAFPGSDGFFPHGGSAPTSGSVRPSRIPSASLATVPPRAHGPRVHLGRPSVPPTRDAAQRFSPSLSPSPSPTSRLRSRSSRSPSSPASTGLGLVAEDSASPSPVSAEIPVGFSQGLASPASSAAPSSAPSRPTLPSTSTSSSFPRSVQLDEGTPEIASPSMPITPPPQEADYFAATPRRTTTVDSRRPFSRSSLAPVRPASLAESDLSPATLDAFPAPPGFQPWSHAAPTSAQTGVRDSLTSTAEASSTFEHAGPHTPSTSLSMSTVATTLLSAETPSVATRNAEVALDFSQALSTSTFVPAAGNVGAAAMNSPSVSRPSSSLGACVLEDLVDELVAAEALRPLPAATAAPAPKSEPQPRPAAVFSMAPAADKAAMVEEEQGPPVPPKEEVAARPRFARGWTLPAQPGTLPLSHDRNASLAPAPAPAAAAKLAASRTRSSSTSSWRGLRLPDRGLSGASAAAAAAAAALAARSNVLRSMPQSRSSSAITTASPPGPFRRVHFQAAAGPAEQTPTPKRIVVVVSDAQLDFRRKRGFSRDEVGDWIARARKEIAEQA